METKFSEMSLSRREFLSAAVIAGGCLALGSAASPAFAEEVSTLATTGHRINPYSVAMSGARTLSSYADEYMYFELRRAIYNDSYWLWVRGSVLKGSNAVFSWGTRLVTPYGTVNDGLIYGGGDAWIVGSQGCTPAICIGMPTSEITVTYYGHSWAGTQSKTVKIPAESIARLPEFGA